VREASAAFSSIELLSGTALYLLSLTLNADKVLSLRAELPESQCIGKDEGHELHGREDTELTLEALALENDAQRLPRT